MEYFARTQREFVYKYVVLLSDTDQFKHMSFANYLKLMFLATDALFVCCQEEAFLAEYQLKLLKSKMQFRRQTVAGDQTLIKINSADILEDSFTLLYTFIIEGSGDLVGLGKQSFKLVQAVSGAGAGLPDKMLDLLKPIMVDESNLLYKY